MSLCVTCPQIKKHTLNMLVMYVSCKHNKDMQKILSHITLNYEPYAVRARNTSTVNQSENVYVKFDF